MQIEGNWPQPEEVGPYDDTSDPNVLESDERMALELGLLPLNEIPDGAEVCCMDWSAISAETELRPSPDALGYGPNNRTLADVVLAFAREAVLRSIARHPYKVNPDPNSPNRVVPASLTPLTHADAEEAIRTAAVLSGGRLRFREVGGVALDILVLGPDMAPYTEYYDQHLADSQFNIGASEAALRLLETRPEDVEPISDRAWAKEELEAHISNAYVGCDRYNPKKRTVSVARLDKASILTTAQNLLYDQLESLFALPDGAHRIDKDEATTLIAEARHQKQTALGTAGGLPAAWLSLQGSTITLNEASPDVMYELPGLVRTAVEQVAAEADAERLQAARYADAREAFSTELAKLIGRKLPSDKIRRALFGILCTPDATDDVAAVTILMNSSKTLGRQEAWEWVDAIKLNIAAGELQSTDSNERWVNDVPSFAAFMGPRSRRSSARVAKPQQRPRGKRADGKQQAQRAAPPKQDPATPEWIV